MLETPGISVSVPATNPAVQDSAVAIVRFFLLQIVSRFCAASTMSSSIISGSTPGTSARQPDRCRRKGGNAFATTSKAQTLAGGCLHGNPIGGDTGNFGNPGTHDVAVWPNARCLTDDRNIEMRNLAPARRDALHRKTQEPVGRGATPLRIARREVGTDVAISQCAKNGID